MSVRGSGPAGRRTTTVLSLAAPDAAPSAVASGPGLPPGAVDVVRAERSRRRSRERAVTGGVLLVVAAASALSLALGDYGLDPGGLVRALLGRGSALDTVVVRELRLPRTALAVVVGMAFALAGGVFQTVFANPLASPDLLGVTGGASVAAVWALLVVGASGPVVGLSAFVGAATVATFLAVLSRRDLSGHRFVLTGIGVAFMSTGAIGFLLTRANVRAAQSALVWTVGSLGAARWSEVAVVAAVVAVLGAVLALAVRSLRALQLGPVAASSLGVPVHRARAVVLAAAVGLVAAATAVVGPVGFVALAAPPIARRLVGTGSLALPAVAGVGAAMVLVADLVAQHALPGVVVPTGVVTGAVGAPYLLWLLSRGGRS